MAASYYNKKVAVALLVMALIVVASDAAISCGGVSRSVFGCLPYLKGGRMPSRGCCGGVKSLVAHARSTRDHRSVCGCLKQAARSIKGINFRNAATLPGRCGVRVPFPISPNTDCSRIH